jgi:hypothetical protein
LEGDGAEDLKCLAVKGMAGPPDSYPLGGAVDVVVVGIVSWSPSRKKFGASLRAFNDWARRLRHKQTKGEMLIRAKARMSYCQIWCMTMGQSVFQAASRCSSWVSGGSSDTGLPSL